MSSHEASDVPTCDILYADIEKKKENLIVIETSSFKLITKCCFDDLILDIALH